MPYSNMINNYQSSKYIVDADGTTPFSTIQSAINQVVTDGVIAPILIEIRPGTYSEDLTLVSNVSLSGCSQAISNSLSAPIAPVIVNGTHIPPAAGQIAFSNIFFVANTDVLNTNIAGTCNIGFDNCVFACNGFAANLTNWTGNFIFTNCSEFPSVANGILSNTAGASIDIINSQIGAGSSPMSVSGPTRISFSKIFCGIDFNLIAAAEIDASLIDGPITVNNSSQLLINNSYINSGANAAITDNSPREVILNNVVINSSATSFPYVLDGSSGTGVNIGEIVFTDKSTINPGLPINAGSTIRVGTLIAEGSVTARAAYGSPVGPTNQIMVIDNTGLVGSTAIPSAEIWTTATTSLTAAVDTGYSVQMAIPGLCTITLPASSVFGDIFEVAGYTVGGWKIAQNALQQINYINTNTTNGVTGYLASTQRYDTVKLLCVVPNTEWQVIGSNGTLTVA